jgi:hypothetical protein
MLSVLLSPAVVAPLAVAFVLLIGLAVSAARLAEVYKKRERLIEFRDKFIVWANSRYSDESSYTTLILQSTGIQITLGKFGRMVYRPPYEKIMYHDWEVILNAIPMIRRYSDGISERMADDHSQLVDETLIRGIGAYDERTKDLARAIRNPLRWASTGMTYILTLPVLLLAEFGILSKKTYDWILASLVVRSIAFLAWSLGLLSAVMSIMMGWGDFLKMVKPLLHLS